MYKIIFNSTFHTFIHISTVAKFTTSNSSHSPPLRFFFVVYRLLPIEEGRFLAPIVSNYLFLFHLLLRFSRRFPLLLLPLLPSFVLLLFLESKVWKNGSLGGEKRILRGRGCQKWAFGRSGRIRRKWSDFIKKSNITWEGVQKMTFLLVANWRWRK